jgi:hypothetical protein
MSRLFSHATAQVWPSITQEHQLVWRGASGRDDGATAGPEKEAA